ncbi:MAG: hypothetical protein HY282_06530 [Nitrospirae bacterium]|nr:hypothetical protein [Candidatus Manganitrophaceae bacterium]
MFSLRIGLLIILVGGFILNGCNTLPPPAASPPAPPPPAAPAPIPTPPLSIPKENPHLEIGQRLLKQGRYKEAIVEFESILKVDPGHLAATNGFHLAEQKIKEERDKSVQSLIQLNERGMEFYHQNEFLKAGQTWKEALNFYALQNDPTLAQELPFPIEEIGTRLEQLIRLFMDKGVLLYRRGELQNAIYAWQDVLLIQPEYTEAKDYIRKAQVKMETLDKLSSSPNPP